MAAKINKTVRIDLQNGSGSHKCASPPIMGGGAGNTGLYDGVKRRGNAGEFDGKDYGNAKGIGGGAKTSDSGRNQGEDSDGY